MAARLLCLIIVLNFMATESFAQAAAGYVRSARSSSKSSSSNTSSTSSSSSGTSSQSSNNSSSSNPNKNTPQATNTRDTVEQRHERMKDRRVPRNAALLSKTYTPSPSTGTAGR